MTAPGKQRLTSQRTEDLRREAKSAVHRIAALVQPHKT